jgi:hypothetical protein
MAGFGEGGKLMEADSERVYDSGVTDGYFRLRHLAEGEGGENGHGLLCLG